MSSSIGEAELQLALQDPGPAEVQSRAAERHTATRFATRQPQTGRSVIPVVVMPGEMKLKSSSEVNAEASTRIKQSKIKFRQQIKLDRLKTLVITQTETGHNQAIADSAPPEEAEALAMDSDEELQRAISFSLEHFSKHTIEMDATEQDNNTNISIAPEATAKHCTSCKGTKQQHGFLLGSQRATSAGLRRGCTKARMQCQKMKTGQARNSAAQRSGVCSEVSHAATRRAMAASKLPDH